MKKLLLLLSIIGLIFVACSEEGGQEPNDDDDSSSSTSTSSGSTSSSASTSTSTSSASSSSGGSALAVFDVANIVYESDSTHCTVTAAGGGIQFAVNNPTVYSLHEVVFANGNLPLAGNTSVTINFGTVTGNNNFWIEFQGGASASEDRYITTDDTITGSDYAVTINFSAIASHAWGAQTHTDLAAGIADSQDITGLVVMIKNNVAGVASSVVIESITIQ